MLPRTLATALRAAVRRWPVVSVTGPRQSGKTTLVRSALASHHYVSLEDPDRRAFAAEDPRGFLEHLRGPAILDEVQRAPDLLSYIQTRVDEDDRPGRYVLTGSQNLLLLREVSQSLAGRTAVLHLLPFSLSELERRRPLDPNRLGQRTPPASRRAGRDVWETLHTGFYPRIHHRGLAPGDWLPDYYRTYVERDVRNILNVGDLGVFDEFVRLCAGRSGQLLNLSALASDCGITHTTARRWLSVLEASFLVWRLRPHHANFRKRLVKSPKLYLLDTGLLCYLLGIRSADALRSHAMRGAVFESFVVSELLKTALHLRREPDLHFWRDASGHEVDILVGAGERPLPLEVKAGMTVAPDALAGLDWWRRLSGNPDGPAALVYAGAESYRRRGVAVTSWSVL